MNSIALVTDPASLPVDYDMPLLLDACAALGLSTEVCSWEEQNVDWCRFDAVVLRSPWSYMTRLPEFLRWVDDVVEQAPLINPLPVVRWNIDKRYLADLAAYGVPVVPTEFVDPGADPRIAVQSFLDTNPLVADLVIKPVVGAYSMDVRRCSRNRPKEAADHLKTLLETSTSAMLQPYLSSVDRNGETDMSFFDGFYSHAIRKGSLLLPDGTTSVPTLESRSARVADDDERALGSNVLAAVASHLSLEQALLYARIDLVRDDDGEPVVLELEVCEPSLNLSFADSSADRFASALARRLEPAPIAAGGTGRYTGASTP